MTVFKKLRLEKGLTLEKLARELKTSYNTIWRIESGYSSMPSLDIVLKYANFFEVSVDYLLGRSDRMLPTK